MLNYDALLAALVAGSVTLAAFLFLPWIADEIPDLARTAIVYLAVLLGASWLFQFWLRRRRK